MKVLIATGGTGGHLFPAQALADSLEDSGVEVLFAGGGLSCSPYFAGEKYRYRDIAAPSANRLLRCWRGGMGVIYSFSVVREFKPDLIVGFGCFSALPVLLAGLMVGVPVVLHEANAVPGKVNRLLSGMVEVTGIHIPWAKRRLKGRTECVGMPLRKGLEIGMVDRGESYRYFGFDESKRVLLVMGGSQGALTLNRLVMEAISKGDGERIQVIHCTGKGKLEEEISQLYSLYGVTAHVTQFEERMDYAWKVADLVIGRSGASTLAEQIEFEVPGILVPYPYATDRHQQINGSFMEEIGGAISIEESVLSAQLLAENVNLFLDHPERMDLFRGRIREYKKGRGEKTLCSLTMDLLRR